MKVITGRSQKQGIALAISLGMMAVTTFAFVTAAVDTIVSPISDVSSQSSTSVSPLTDTPSSTVAPLNDSAIGSSSLVSPNTSVPTIHSEPLIGSSDLPSLNTMSPSTAVPTSIISPSDTEAAQTSSSVEGITSVPSTSTGASSELAEYSSTPVEASTSVPVYAVVPSSEEVAMTSTGSLSVTAVPSTILNPRADVASSEDNTISPASVTISANTSTAPSAASTSISGITTKPFMISGTASPIPNSIVGIVTQQFTISAGIVPVTSPLTGSLTQFFTSSVAPSPVSMPLTGNIFQPFIIVSNSVTPAVNVLTGHITSLFSLSNINPASPNSLIGIVTQPFTLSSAPAVVTNSISGTVSDEPNQLVGTTLAIDPISDLPWGTSLTITGKLLTSDDQSGIEGATVELSGTGTIGFDTISTTTSPDGTFSFSGVSPDSVGSFEAHVSFAGNSSLQASSANVDYDTLKHTTSLTLNLKPGTVKTGKQFTAFGMLIDSTTQESLRGKTVTFTTTSPISLSDFTTDSKGKYRQTGVAPTTKGSYNIAASFAGDGLYEVSNSPTKVLKVN